MGLLEKFSSDEIDMFASDMKLILSIIRNLDIEYANAKREFIHDFAHFRHLLKEWNRKYRHILLSHHEDGMELKLKISIKGVSMDDVLKAAVRCGELLKFNGRPVTMEDNSLMKLIDGTEKSAELVFADDSGKENSVSLEVEKKNSISVTYYAKDLSVSGTPEFELCAFFALSDYDYAINLQKFSYTFSFSTDFQESEGKGEGYLNRVRLFDKI